MAENPPLDDAGKARIFARLTDMRRTLGDEAFVALIERACVELENLARRHAPWPPAAAEQGLNTAMLLGLHDLESACRRIIEGGTPDTPPPASQAAKAVEVLRVFLDTTPAPPTDGRSGAQPKPDPPIS